MLFGRCASTLSLLVLLVAGSTAISHAASKAAKGFVPPNATLLVCSGYGCVLKDRFSLTKKQQGRLRNIMVSGQKSATLERKAVARAIAAMETYARGRLRYKADIPKAPVRYNGYRGQMDCIDESLNTTAYLTYLHGRGWLRHHKPRKSYAERGFILDGRYPHKSAVMIQKNGKKWAVDSWYKRDGKPPAIKPLKQWRRER